jgi:serine/threonine protein kinase/Flp pilus assembly protein TadD
MSDKAERLLEQALSLDPDERIAFIRAETYGDVALRDELESLVNEAASADQFFDQLDNAVFSTPITVDDGVPLTGFLRDAQLREGDMAGHYRIIAIAGRGGMGAVYRAHDTRLNREVALKFLPSYLGADTTARDRLMMEARVAAALDHPNVCAIHEIGETESGHLFIAMPFYKGETLRDRLRRSSLSMDEALSTAIQITRGLTAAHSRGIIHRDVKPGNVVVADDGTVRLLDFGLAMPVDSNPESAGATPGTVAYMSPEHARGAIVDQRSDLWSLGVVLYEMLAGIRPFRGASGRAVLAAILNENPEPLESRCPEIPPALAAMTLRLLEKEPGNRYASGSELLSDLQKVHASMSYSRSRSATTVTRFASAGGALLLLALIGGSLWLRSPGKSPGHAARASTRNVAAYELYKLGSDPVLMRSDSGARAAFLNLQQAIALDSNYAAAHSALARLYLRIGFGGNDSALSRRERLVLAEKEAMKGVTLDSMSGGAHLALGLVRRSTYEMKSAEQEMLKAVAIDPKSSMIHEKVAFLYVITGRPHDALREARLAVQLDPLSPSARAEVANALMRSDQCDQALAELERLRSLRPPLLRASGIAAQCYARKQRWAEAIAETRRILPDGGPRAQATLGYVLGRSGNKAEATKVLDALIDRSKQNNGDSFEVAIVYAGLGDMDRAMTWLAKSVEDRSFGFDWFGGIEAEFRKDPRFAAIARRTGITPRPDR